MLKIIPYYFSLHLFRFQIVNSLLEMPGSELKSVMCDPKGSHVMTAFIKSEHVGEKSRERLLHRLLVSRFYIILI